MKKIFLLLVLSIILMSGCGYSKKERTMDELMKLYIKAYTKADYNAAKNIFPPFYVDYAKDYLTKEYLENALNQDKKEYGKDFTVSYKITNTIELTDSELENLNIYINSNFNTNDKALICYKYEGKLFYKGSLKEESESISPIKNCKYKNGWYLIRY